MPISSMIFSRLRTFTENLIILDCTSKCEKYNGQKAEKSRIIYYQREQGTESLVNS